MSRMYNPVGASGDFSRKEKTYLLFVYLSKVIYPKSFYFLSSCGDAH